MTTKFRTVSLDRLRDVLGFEIATSVTDPAEDDTIVTGFGCVDCNSDDDVATEINGLDLCKTCRTDFRAAVARTFNSHQENPMTGTTQYDSGVIDPESTTVAEMIDAVGVDQVAAGIIAQDASSVVADASPLDIVAEFNQVAHLLPGRAGENLAWEAGPRAWNPKRREIEDNIDAGLLDPATPQVALARRLTPWHVDNEHFIWEQAIDASDLKRGDKVRCYWMDGEFVTAVHVTDVDPTGDFAVWSAVGVQSLADTDAADDLRNALRSALQVARAEQAETPVDPEDEALDAVKNLLRPQR